MAHKAINTHQKHYFDSTQPFEESSIQSTCSIRSNSAIIDQIFIIACVLRCKTLPCTLKKIDKNTDLLTRYIHSQLTSLGYEQDLHGLTEESLIKIINSSSGDTISLRAHIIRLPDGSCSLWGGAFAPTGSQFEVAHGDLIEATKNAKEKLLALTRMLYIQVEFLRHEKDAQPLCALLHDSIVHYGDAKRFVKENQSFAQNIVHYFNLDALSNGILGEHIIAS